MQVHSKRWALNTKRPARGRHGYENTCHENRNGRTHPPATKYAKKTTRTERAERDGYRPPERTQAGQHPVPEEFEERANPIPMRCKPFAAASTAHRTRFLLDILYYSESEAYDSESDPYHTLRDSESLKIRTEGATPTIG